MTKKNDHGLVIEYRFLGTISIDEFAQAVFTDLQVLKDQFNVRYVTAPRIRVPITNEYGDRLQLKAPTGGTVERFDTHHYRPACKDYEL